MKIYNRNYNTYDFLCHHNFIFIIYPYMSVNRDICFPLSCFQPFPPDFRRKYPFLSDFEPEFFLACREQPWRSLRLVDNNAFIC